MRGAHWVIPIQVRVTLRIKKRLLNCFCCVCKLEYNNPKAKIIELITVNYAFRFLIVL
jgi:hypothetical protein